MFLDENEAKVRNFDPHKKEFGAKSSRISFGRSASPGSDVLIDFQNCLLSGTSFGNQLAQLLRTSCLKVGDKSFGNIGLYVMRLLVTISNAADVLEGCQQ